jgi:ComF family protein
LPNFNAPGGYICANCELHPPPYSGARSFGRYASELSRIIQELKFKGRRNLVGLVAPLLASVYFENWGREAFDLITPVPLHPKRKGDRGYNQSELLARALSRQIAIPFEHALLRRIPTVAQVGLTHAQRLENVRGAFECRNTLSVADKRILLIDDVFTTGATISSATKTLLDAGALRVSVLTVARSLSDN